MNLKQTALVASLSLAGLAASADAAPMTYLGAGGAVPPSGTSGLFTDTITVTDDVSIADVSLTLTDFSHSWIGDFYATLVFDDGVNPLVSLELFGDEGSLGPSNDVNGTYEFVDGGAADFASAGNPVPSGSYAASGSFSVFQGLSSAGSWTLNLDDQHGGDSGSLGSWSLTIDGRANGGGNGGAPVPLPGSLALLAAGLLGLRARYARKV